MESSLQNFFNPARLALMPNLVRDEDLRAANSLMEMSRHIGFLIAPSAGVILADFVGSSTIILADGVTFLISGVTVFFIKWRQPKRMLEQAAGWRDRVALVARETREGISVILNVRLLQVTILLGFVLNLVVAPIQTLLPLYVFDVRHQSGAYFGLLAAMFVTGLLLGSLGAPSVSQRVGLGRMTIASVLTLGATICIAAYLPTLIVPGAAQIIAGIAIGLLNVSQVNMLQTSTTDEERGRVSAAYYSATLGVRTVGYFLAGVLVAPLGVQPLFVVFGVLVLAVGAALYREPVVRSHA
jgi:MFS family permease